MNFKKLFRRATHALIMVAVCVVFAVLAIVVTYLLQKCGVSEFVADLISALGVAFVLFFIAHEDE